MSRKKRNIGYKVFVSTLLLFIIGFSSIYIYNEFRQVSMFSDSYTITFDEEFPSKWHIGKQDGYYPIETDFVKAYVKDNVLDKENVLTLEDTSKDYLIEVARRFGYWDKGEIEFDIAGEGIIDSSNYFSIHICQEDHMYNPKGDIIIRFGKDNKIKISNNKENPSLVNIEENEWYHIRIKFDKKLGFKVWIENESFNYNEKKNTAPEWFEFYDNREPEFFSQLYFYSMVSSYGENYKLYIDNIEIRRVY